MPDFDNAAEKAAEFAFPADVAAELVEAFAVFYVAEERVIDTDLRLRATAG